MQINRKKSDSQKNDTPPNGGMSQTDQTARHRTERGSEIRYGEHASQRTAYKRRATHPVIECRSHTTTQHERNARERTEIHSKRTKQGNSITADCAWSTSAGESCKEHGRHAYRPFRTNRTRRRANCCQTNLRFCRSAAKWGCCKEEAPALIHQRRYAAYVESESATTNCLPSAQSLKNESVFISNSLLFSTGAFGGAEHIGIQQREVLASSLWNTSYAPFRNGRWVYLAERGNLRGATERINYLGVIHGPHFRRT